MSARRPRERLIDAVVIGGSAGGIEALSAVLPALPAGLEVAIFIALHLPRSGPSLLTDIFRPKCSLPVQEAQDKEPVQPGVIYFAPPDYHLLVDCGPQLALSSDELVNFSRPAVDVLFESAADIYGERLLGVVLSGGNHDGAAGLRSIHDAGGRVAVQDPRDARMPLMPESAIALTPQAHVLAAAQMAGFIQSLGAAEAGPAHRSTP